MDAPEVEGLRIARLHQALIDSQVREGNISSPAVEAAFRAVPRHLFLPGVPLEEVYRDQAIMTKYLNGTRIPISSSSQPAIMAIMLEQLQLEPGQRVLEIGAGTGYNAALMAHIVGEKGLVVSIDIDEDTVEMARAHLAAAGYARVHALRADGGQGYPGAAPYDRIILSVGSSDILPAWREQLRTGGRLVMPLSIRETQVAVAFEQVEDHLRGLSIHACRFMMLRGDFGGDGLRAQVGPEPAIFLESSERRSVDTNAIYRQLARGGQDIPLGIEVSWHEMFFQLSTWLALYEPDLCRFTIDAGLAAHAIFPNPPAAGANRKFISTIGLLAEQALSILVYHPTPAQNNPPGSQEQSPEWIVRTFGPDASLGQRLLAQAQAWDSAGRPGLERLSIKAYPAASTYTPRAGEFVIPRSWIRLVCSWK
jgi:protein-L-isoaspartate(D-aspartate) O-methyltransferase